MLKYGQRGYARTKFSHHIDSDSNVDIQSTSKRMPTWKTLITTMNSLRKFATSLVMMKNQ